MATRGDSEYRRFAVFRSSYRMNFAPKIGTTASGYVRSPEFKTENQELLTTYYSLLDD